MGGAAYSTNNRVNAAVAAKANARQPLEEVVSLNADPFPSTVPRQAKFYSDMSMAERREVDAIEAGLAPSLNLNTYQGMPDLDFGVGTQYDSPEEALGGYGDYFSNIQDQRKSAAGIINYNQFDPSDFAREGTAGSPQAVIGVASGKSLADYITKNDIPLTKEVDGKTMYLTTGDDNASFSLMPDKYKGGELVAQGPVGTYSSVFVKDDNLVESFLKEPIINLAASFIPAGTLAMTAAKTAAGVEVSPMEIASSMLTGLEMAGAIKKPVVFDNGEYGGALGGVDPFTAGDLGTAVADAGTGLFGSTYAQTQTALNVAAAGDLKGAALSLVGTDLLTNNLDKIGLNKEAIESAGIQYDDFEAGLNKVVSAVAGGANLDDALVQGLGKYIREGGTLGSVDLPSVDLGVDLSGLGKMVETIVNTAEDIGRPLVALAEDVSKPVGDVLSALDTAVRDVLPNISIDLPSVDLPNIDLPSIDLSLGTNGMLQYSPTATTDKLFGDELFKFKTEIGLDIEPLEYVDLNTPSNNFFEDTLYEDPILGRSYNF